MSKSSLTDLHADLRQSPEYTVHEMLDQIRYQLRRRIADLDGMTQAALAVEMGVTPSVVSRLLRAAENTSLLTVARAARALGLTFTSIKFVPDDEADLQVDEFSTLLSTEGTSRGWWCRTQKPGAHAWRYTPETFSISTNPAVPADQHPDESYSVDLAGAFSSGFSFPEFS